MKSPSIVLFLKIILVLIVSWVLVHFLAAFGLFLALILPLLVIFSNNYNFCPYCRLKRSTHSGQNCPFKHLLYSFGFILVFTFVSIGLVFLESRVLFQIGFPPTPKTAFFVIPPKGQYRLGEIFPLEIEIAGIKVPINAIQADLGFDPRKLEVVDVSTQDSFANIFIQKEINNEAGWIRLTGGLPNPGFFAEKGLFGTVFLKGTSPGIVQIEFLPSSLVLANDGRGTNVLKEFINVSYLILPDRLNPEEEEAQKQLTFKTETVLGEKSENTQMRFYQEKRILGAQTEKEAIKEAHSGLFHFLLKILESFNHFILSAWVSTVVFPYQTLINLIK